MKIRFKGNGIDISEKLREHTIRSLNPFNRHLREIEKGEVETIVTFTYEEHGQRHRVDIDIYLETPGGGVIHASEETNDVYKSLNLVSSDVDRQLKKLKAQRHDEKIRASMKHKEISPEEQVSPSPTELVIEESLEISKLIDLKDALMILMDEDKFFFPHRNADTGQICILYRKKSGEFGHIVP